VKSALFLDRDGVINRDLGYVHRIEAFEFLDGIFDLCRAARDADLEIHVVTNQAGIGRGYYTETEFAVLSEWMTSRFMEQGVEIIRVHHCPFHPEYGLGEYQRQSSRRKPAPGMILDAAAEHGLDLSNSVMVGDKATDMQAAQAAGVRYRILFSSDPTEIAIAPAGGIVATSLPEATRLLQTAAALLWPAPTTHL
jgi:D-glycero-D-manno-heptose 1,7-bisphosphate phosphatase